MNHDTESYTLEWRGRQTEPMSLDAIREALETGDIHTMYKVNERGKWRLLRDFLEDHDNRRASYRPPEPARSSPPAPPPLPAGHGGAPWGGTPAQQENPWPPAPERASAAPARTFEGKAARPGHPAWLVPTLIALVVVLVPALLIGGYMVLRPGTSAVAVSADKTPEEEAADESVPREKSPKEETTVVANAVKKRAGSGLTVEELSEQKSGYVVRVSSRWEEPDEKGVWKRSGSTGSGVHISNKGGHAIFVTNRHVVEPPENARKVYVSINFKDQQLPCELVGVARYDLDLVKVRVKYPEGKDGSVLDTMKMDQLKVGQQCVAIGNALGAGISVTDGIISRFDEEVECTFVRTSAPISPGNSGGGLFRLSDGVLIGITTAGMEGSAQNINFAIPVDYIFSDLFWVPVTN